MMESAADNATLIAEEEKGWTARICQVLEVVRRVVVKNAFCIPKAETELLVQKMDRIEMRLNENRLKIAMIGAFSSGKSTFINALLAEKVLKSAKRACTAAVTEIHHGSNEIVVKMKDGNHKRFSDIRHPVIIDEAFIDYLERYQTDNAYAKNVERICVTIEKDILDNDAILLDTPGFNSGDDLHQEVIERVLSEEADAGVFVFSAQIAADQAEFEILERFKDKLGAIFFVVTKIDKADQTDETKAVIQNVQVKLQEAFNLPTPPRVAGVAPLQVLKDSQGKYAAAFAEFQSTLLTFSKTRKLFILTNGTIAVLRQAIGNLHKRAKTHEEKLSSEQDRLKKLQREAPADFIKKEMGLARDEIRKAKESVSFRLNRNFESAWEKCSISILNLVDEVDSSDKETLRRRGLELFAVLQREIINQWEREGFYRLETNVNQIAKKFEKRFKEYYENLEELKTPLPRGEPTIVIPMSLSPLGRLEKMLRNDLLSFQKTLDVWYAPIINFVFGKKKKVREKWRTDLNHICKQIQQQMDIALEKACEYLMQQIVDQRVNQYATTYTDDIHKEIRLVKEKLSEIGRQRREVLISLRDLDEQKSRLEHEIAQLEVFEIDIKKIEVGDVKLDHRLWSFIDRLISLCRRYDYDAALSFLLENANLRESVPALLYMEGIFKRRCGESASSNFNRFFSGVLHDEQNLLDALWHLGQIDFEALASTYYEVDYDQASSPAKELLALFCCENAFPKMAIDLQIKHLTSLVCQGTTQIKNLIENWNN